VAHLFIDCQWVSPQVPAAADVLNPFDASVLATVDEAGPAGRELGPAGLAEYQEIKHIWHNTAPAPAGWFARAASPPT
jgi:hypothetical protein